LNFVGIEGPLPDFVHKLEAKTLTYKTLGKSAGGAYVDTPVHPDVTMRLETPVIYFYPKKSWNPTSKFSVKVSFHSGLLNEFYPDAHAEQSAFPVDAHGSVAITKESLSSLEWRDISLFEAVNPGPQTTHNEWLAPRNVSASAVKLTNGETERYLFYRGVAKLSPLLRTIYKDDIKIFPPKEWPISTRSELTIPSSWFVSVREDGAAYFKSIGQINLKQGVKDIIATIPADFSKQGHSAEQLLLLRKAMHSELIKRGLFEDEAQAMLKTWEASYFQKAGARIFYIVPAAWTDHFLPLKVSVPSKITRVIMGRIDLPPPIQF